MPIRIKTTGAADYGRFLKVLVVGEPGGGKTRFAATWPNPFYADANAGLMSIAHRQLPYATISSSTDLKELRAALDNPLEDRTEIFGRPIETIILDTFDDIQDIFVKERMKAQKKDKLDLQDWGWLGERCKEVVLAFRNLQMHVVFICHIREVGEDDERTRRPNLTGQIRENITGYMDIATVLRSRQATKIVGDKTEKVMEHLLLTQPDRLHPWLKDRSGKLPPEFELNFENDFQRLHELIFAGIENLPETTERALNVPTQPVVVEGAPVPASTQSLDDRMAAARARNTTPDYKAAEDKSNVDAGTGEVLTQTINPVAAEPHQVSELFSAADTKSPEPTEPKCADCGGPVTNDEATISKIRYRGVVLDHKCFLARRNKAA